MIPDFAIAMLCREPPNAARCSHPTVVMTDAANSVLCMTFVASLAPPRPASTMAMSTFSRENRRNERAVKTSKCVRAPFSDSIDSSIASLA